MGSSFGDLFRISTFGESHGGGVGVIVEGCPPRLELDLQKIQAELDRRKPGQSKISTPRKEEDQVEILSGLLNNTTLGTPIAMVVRNKDHKPGDYKEMNVAFRPSHADATYQAKYGIQARSGGGRASARETIARVAAGAIAITGLLVSITQALTAVVGGYPTFDRHRCATIGAAALSTAFLALVCAWNGYDAVEPCF